MKTIDLRDYYPELYEYSYKVNVPDAVYMTLQESVRKENAYLRQILRYNAYYSLDRDDGIEKAMLNKPVSLQDAYEQEMMREQLYCAIRTLPEKQAMRIYAHFYMGMSVTEIARAERVSKSRISESISKGLRKLKRVLKENA